MERFGAICRTLYEHDPALQLLEQLRSLRELMQDWTSPSGWQLHGAGPAVLRGQLMECLDEVAELTGSSALEPTAAATPLPSRHDAVLPTFA